MKKFPKVKVVFDEENNELVFLVKESETYSEISYKSVGKIKLSGEETSTSVSGEHSTNTEVLGN